MSLCRILNCQNCDTHVTQAHKCETCGKFGHGSNECGNDARINLLKVLSEYDRLPENKFCTIKYCRYYWSHTNEFHYCKKCKNRGHSSSSCRKINNLVVICPICRVVNSVNKHQKKVFGLQEKCKICVANPVEVYLPECGHTVMCMECAKSISN